MSTKQYASSYFSGKTEFLSWKDTHEMNASREEIEDAIRQFLAIFESTYPQEFKQLAKSDPNIKAAVRMFGKGV